MATATELPKVRQQLKVRGTVQGVGFRPYVYRMARHLGLSGFVCNSSSSVMIEIEGPAARVEQFASRL